MQQMKTILVFGPPGSGKSYLSNAWRKMGIHTVDGDAMGPSVCRWVREDGTEDPFPEELKDADVEWFNTHTFLWDRDALGTFLAEQEPLVVLGVSDNVFDVLDLFDQVYYLRVPHAVARERLVSTTRQAFTAFGQHEEQREALEQTIHELDQKAKTQGIEQLDAVLSPTEQLEHIDLGEFMHS